MNINAGLQMLKWMLSKVIHPSLIQIISSGHLLPFIEHMSFSRSSTQCDWEMGLGTSFRLTVLASSVVNYIPHKILDRPLPFGCSKSAIVILNLLSLASTIEPDPFHNIHDHSDALIFPSLQVICSRVSNNIPHSLLKVSHDNKSNVRGNQDICFCFQMRIASVAYHLWQSCVREVCLQC